MDVALFLLQEIDLKIWSNPGASGGFAPRTPIWSQGSPQTPDHGDRIKRVHFISILAMHLIHYDQLTSPYTSLLIFNKIFKIKYKKTYANVVL